MTMCKKCNSPMAEVSRQINPRLGLITKEEILNNLLEWYKIEIIHKCIQCSSQEITHKN